MWRRAVCSQIKTLAAATQGAASSSRLPHASRSIISPAVSSSLFNRNFSAVADGALRKPVQGMMPIATGHEREELEAEMQGKDILDINHPVGPFGTKEEPAIVKSYYDRRIVGCPGGEEEDEHDVVWFWLEKGKPFECPVCSQHFVLEVEGPGGDPEAGHGDH